MTEVEAVALRYYLVGIMYGSNSYRQKLLEQAESDSDLPKGGIEILRWIANEFEDYGRVKNASRSRSGEW